MIADEKTANAVGGRTARACESCLRHRARWYCAADDAFLCGGCDASVHSANQLARRHERVRLKTAPPPLTCGKPSGHSLSPPSSDDSVMVPAWHGGFTRKARTPRRKSLGPDGGVITKVPSLGDLVPELSGEFDVSTASMDESDDGFQCLVPVFDPFGEVGDCDLVGVGGGDGGACDDLDIGLLLPSEVYLGEFTVDVESLLEEVRKDGEIGKEVKVEDELLLGDDETAASHNLEVAGPWEVAAEAAADWDDLEFRLQVATVGEEGAVEEKPAVVVAAAGDQTDNLGRGDDEEKQAKTLLLRLNYEDVITAWASHGSPWTGGTRPDFRLENGWPQCTGSYASDVHNQHGSNGDLMGPRGHSIGGDDKGREARVSRYREKRRTRMFSKKIRYQVRKLNAEKRPRMKGRFVKRTSSFDKGGPELSPSFHLRSDVLISK